MPSYTANSKTTPCGSIDRTGEAGSSYRTPKKSPGKNSAKTPFTPVKSIVKTPRTGKKKTPIRHDRFIPCLPDDIEVSHFNLTSNPPPPSDDSDPYRVALSNSLLEGKLGERILTFKKKAPVSSVNDPSLLSLYQSGSSSSAKTYQRHIPTTSERTLDAPNVLDDYYLNLLDWSSNNILAVALSESVYLWQASTGKIDHLMDLDPGFNVTSVAWTKDAKHLAIGTEENCVQLWDVVNAKRARTMHGHAARVSSLSWNGHILSSGSRDGSIIHHDVRIAQHKISVLQGHSGEVCGLSWSPDGTQLASGGNDNIVNIWNSPEQADSSSPVFSFTDHQGAVKALSWCPWQHKLLATGGGLSDRKIMFWNTGTGTRLNCIDTRSQVSSILWSPHTKELVSAHGFSDNQLTVWKYPSMQKLGELKGHSGRILQCVLSPDGEMAATVAADECLKFWKVFEKPSKSPTKRKATVRSVSNMNVHIR